MRKYALINNNIVTAIQDCELEEVFNLSKNNQMVIDIEDMSPQPSVNYVLNGNKLELPQGFSDREQYEIHLAAQKTDCGIKLAYNTINKMGARNKILNKSGTQVSELLTQLLPVKLLLETGALGTARAACSQLKIYYTEYADIFDEVINAINDFENQFGL